MCAKLSFTYRRFWGQSTNDAWSAKLTSPRATGTGRWPMSHAPAR